MRKTIKIIIALISIPIITVMITACSSNSNKADSTNIDTSPASILASGEGSAASETKLNLSNKKLKQIPAVTYSKNSLEELNVSNNQLSGSIQSEIRQLSNLKVLNASNNQMTGVPAEIGQLKNLEVLDLSNNQITGLPNELANLKKLKTLNISGNNYSEFDLEIIQKGLPKNVKIIK